jgi:hypothetical protein
MNRDVRGTIRRDDVAPRSTGFFAYLLIASPLAHVLVSCFHRLHIVSLMKPSLLFCIISFILMTASQSLHNVAVIGAGASGLAAARILSRNGLAPTVLEQSSQIGGVWDYKVSSSSHPMYRGLRTNLPREIMAFREKKWTRGSKRCVDTCDDHVC